MSNNRVDVKYHHWFSSQSDNGKSFGWLKAHLGPASDDAITNLVRLVYLPIALASEGASRQEVEAQIKKARNFFNEKMMVALGSCCEQESNGLPFSNGSTPIPSRTIYPVEVVLPSTENPSSDTSATTLNKAPIAPGSSTPDSSVMELKDDFLELDEDKLMEGFSS